MDLPGKEKYELVWERTSLNDLFAQLCRKHKLTKEFAFTGRRRDARSCARRLFCKQSVQQFGYSALEVAVFLAINASSVKRMICKTDEGTSYP
jgi:hypothetical protein